MFKESKLMYGLAAAVIVFVLAQSFFFMIKAWKQGKKLGLSSQTLRSTVTSSVLFSIAPAVSVVATVIVLAKALGIVLPWIRLSVIGNITYETTAAEAALNVFGSSVSEPVQDPQQFSAIMWVMTVGCIFPLILLPIFLKTIQKKIGHAAQTNAKLADVISAAAFIGLIAAFIARSLAGVGTKDNPADGAGTLSLLVLIISILLMVILTKLCTRFNLKWLENFTMPLSMLGAMGAAILLTRYLPAEWLIEWRY
ncbi:MAG: DUF5058 family protein [Clostridia bacterium]|nr:DUF5058 family protein [Clostridia bacterium]